MIEAPETAHNAHSHGTGHRWFDIVMAVAILLVSAGSLYVALHTGHTMEALVKENERLVRAQSTPILQFSHGNVTDDCARALEFSITKPVIARSSMNAGLPTWQQTYPSL